MTTLSTAIPVLLVTDVPTAAGYWRDRAGFEIDFLYGEPPFYGSVSRDGAQLHLRHVDEPNFVALVEREGALILAFIPVSDVRALHAELVGRGADIVEPLTSHPWGGTDFHVRDPDGNRIAFAELREAGA
jgi:uncharacterized glyoxalase superfamily protein PhnB